MIRPVNPNPEKHIQWFAKAGDACYRGLLVKSDTGATPAADGHTGATLLGVVVESQLTINKAVRIHKALGEVFEIDIKRDASKQSFADTDLGTLYDIKAVSGEHFIDPDDTTGGYLYLVGYNNEARVAYVMFPPKLCLGGA